MEGMSTIVKKVTQLLAGIIFIYGIYIVLHVNSNLKIVFPVLSAKTIVRQNRILKKYY